MIRKSNSLEVSGMSIFVRDLTQEEGNPAYDSSIKTN